jgi:FAD/FMN-containing dehydrogenase
VTSPDVDVAPLRSRLGGRVATSADDDFAALAFGGQWNRLLPSRAPQVIARVRDERDVVEAVSFARAQGLKVAVRGGGHNWANPALRRGGMLIDLTDLNRIVELEPGERRAVVQPVISNREAQRALNAEGLAYPTGHCPQVKLSGYLLGGGMSWNQGSWGPGCASVEAIDLVTPDGELITASEDQHPDLFWAARGAGSGLFAVAVRFHLRLNELPPAIWSYGAYYPIEELQAVAGWLGSVAPDLSERVELSLFLLTAPPDLGRASGPGRRKACMVSAAIFAHSEEEARAGLRSLEEGPVRDASISVSPPAPSSFEELFDLSGALWPEQHRNAVDAMYYDSAPADLAGAVGEHFLSTPSETTVVLFTLFTGANVPAPLPDAAFSMSARIYGGPWTMWTDAADDGANVDWHERCVELLKPHAVGHYVGETNTVAHPEYARAAYSAESWGRLSELRERHDPDGLFFSPGEAVD